VNRLVAVALGAALAPAVALTVAIVGARRWRSRVHWALESS
jgi:hypothetical protein